MMDFAAAALRATAASSPTGAGKPRSRGRIR